MKLFTIFYALPFMAMPLNLSAEASLLKSGQPEHVVVNNRILANVNGKAISVIDLMKKMDLLFYREFPQYASFPEARFQFYEANWKPMLSELIDKELIIADALENKLPVSSGDVRQEMERLFGPNIIGNLDKIGMTFDEAWKIIQGDILLHRMLFIRVNAKAMRQVTPSDVHAYYQEYAKENIQPPKWSYQVISVRDTDPTNGAVTANIVHHLLGEENVALADLPGKLESISLTKSSKVNISELFVHAEKEIAPGYKDIVEKLAANSYSAPVIQQSKDKSKVFRIFYLKELSAGGAPSFNEVESMLKDKLIEKEIAEKAKAYVKKMRDHFDIQEMIPEDFSPFMLK
ncbi:MAG: peptidyl-prolyl cis-trans isomerase [Parachlamydiaceae bacterium]|nr:peptidyl-prolyl cis-trans isomerase [Parachlamydiaceae bacterium]